MSIQRIPSSIADDGRHSVSISRSTVTKLFSTALRPSVQNFDKWVFVEARNFLLMENPNMQLLLLQKIKYDKGESVKILIYFSRQIFCYRSGK